MDLFSHLNEIKLIATLALSYFCFRKLNNARKALDSEMSPSDSEDVQIFDQEESHHEHEDKLEQSLKIDTKISENINVVELSEVCPNSPKSNSQTLEIRNEISEELGVKPKCKPIRKNRQTIKQKHFKFRIQRHRKLKESVCSSEACLIVN